MEKEQSALMDICQKMSIEWDEGMVSWPKKRSDIAYVGKTNQTLEDSMEKGSLTAAKLPGKAKISVDRLPKSELEWLEETFSAYNEFHNYPRKILHSEGKEASSSMPIPCYKGTQMYWLYNEYYRLLDENYRLRTDNTRLRGEKN